MSTRVLIVEDEQSIVASLEFLMHQCGFDTRVARDGNHAIGCLSEYRPDLVLLDIMLPGCSGYEICRHIRSAAGLERTRVLMLTAKGNAAGEARAGEAAADDYLTKPFSTRELVSRVRALLARR